ncbi:MAG TPA: TetR/AcrR family transcriptional regulator [Mycobacteriales bacterium]|jgi:AcrR family transcriptional regulator|nr:TetR/AcrR family transcriptional regulator [Mycobacteriales bacterium]
MATETELATTATPGGSASSRRPRRTQAERRATTRRALLDATLEELDEVGYANLTTASVVARAGVTRGAQAHYFATKAELVVQALRHITDQLIDELIAQPPKRADTMREQYGLLLNRLWELNAGIASTALIELWVASRTDPELAEHLDRFQKEISRHLQETAQTVAPEFTALPQAGELLINGLAIIRGLWLLRAVTSERRIRRLWPAARDQLVAGAGLD